MSNLFTQHKLVTYLRGHRWLAVGVIALLAWFIFVLLIHWVDHVRLKRVARSEDVFPVHVLHPKKSDSLESIQLPGNIMAWNQSYIYSRVDGYVEYWLTDYGATVEKGQLMAKLWTPQLNAEYGQAKAEMKAVEAIYALADLTAKRYEAMSASKAVAIQAISVKQAMLKMEKAKYDAANYRVKTLGARLNFKYIVAPFSGRVISRNINVGDYVNKQGSVTEQNEHAKHMFIVADLQKMRLFVSVPERFGRFLNPTLQADVVFPQYPNRHYKAQFLTSANAFDPETRTVVTEFVLDNEDGSIWPGSYATVTIAAETKGNLLSIPTTAMIFDAHGTRVATVGQDNKVHFKTIKVDQLKSKSVDVIEGLLATDRVINTPNLGMLEGSKVKVLATVADGYFDDQDEA